LVWLVARGSVLAHGDFHERIVELTRKIAEEPGNTQLLLQRAGLSLEHGDWLAAISDCDRVQSIDPSVNTDFLRGRSLLESGRPGDALPLLDACVKKEPQNLLALICRGRAYGKLARTKEAAADFRGALKSTPHPGPDLLQEAANALAANGDSQEAMQVLTEAIKTIGPVPSLVLRALDLEIASRNFDAALTRVETMRQSAPRPEPWMARRAAVLAQAGRIEESQAAWEALVAHLNALPNLQRGSHAMSKLMEDAKLALAALRNLPAAGQPSTAQSTPQASVPPPRP